MLLTSVLSQKRTVYTTLLYWTLIRRRKGKRVDNVRASSKTEPQPQPSCRNETLRVHLHPRCIRIRWEEQN